jgi:hypothetical protein
MKLSMTLEGYIWGVSIISPDDGHTITVSYWTDHSKACEDACKRHGNVYQTSLWMDSSGRYYKVHTEEVGVNLPDRNDVLKKLTPEEKKVLGLD